LKAAYRKAVKTYHPDQGGTSEAFRAVMAAHETLLRQGSWKS
jgi:curved DNA-binding protein CbpA